MHHFPKRRVRDSDKPNETRQNAESRTLFSHAWESGMRRAAQNFPTCGKIGGGVWRCCLPHGQAPVPEERNDHQHDDGHGHDGEHELTVDAADITMTHNGVTGIRVSEGGGWSPGAGDRQGAAEPASCRHRPRAAA